MQNKHKFLILQAKTRKTCLLLCGAELLMVILLTNRKQSKIHLVTYKEEQFISLNNPTTNMQKLIFSFVLLCAFACQSQSQTTEGKDKDAKNTAEVKKSPEQWQTCLTAEQYRILREKGTERAFTGKFYDHHEKGVYTCAGCGHKLFASTTKFDSGTGWPSYYKPYSQYAIKTNTDKSHGMERVEVVCGKCDGHLGHVFDDGPAPTGMRYCINSASLSFETEKQDDKKDKKKDDKK